MKIIKEDKLLERPTAGFLKRRQAAVKAAREERKKERGEEERLNNLISASEEKAKQDEKDIGYTLIKHDDTLKLDDFLNK